MCSANNCDPFGLGLTAVTEVRKHTVYILDDIIVFFYQGLYNIIWPVAL